MANDITRYGTSYGRKYSPNTSEPYVDPRNILFQSRIQSASPKERVRLAREFAMESQKLRNTGLSRGEGQPSLVVPNAPGTGDDPYYTAPEVNVDPRLNRTGIGMGGSVRFPWEIPAKPVPVVPTVTDTSGIPEAGDFAVDTSGIPEAGDFKSPVPPAARKPLAKVAAKPGASSFYPDMSVPRTNMRPVNTGPSHQARLSMLNTDPQTEGYMTNW